MAQIGDLETTVVIQGIEGSFHEIAAQTFFGTDIDMIAASSFPKLMSKLKGDASIDFAVMAIENSISGTLLRNYSLIMEHDLNIVGEIYLRVSQNLLAIPGTRLDEIREVHSHPIAIVQCTKFFDSISNIKLVESPDTAESARYVRDQGIKSNAAIGSSRAAEIFDLEVLNHEIETNKENFTRFWVVQTGESDMKEGNKISLSFTVSHDVGSLHKVLSVIAFHNANLSKIQSVPLIGKPWEYLFFTDLIVDNGNLNHILDGIRPFTQEMKIIGRYQMGKIHES